MTTLKTAWLKVARDAKLRDFRFHDLRHTQASLMLAAGIHPKIVQERLGHGDIALTMNTYSHLLSGLQAESVERMGAMIPRAPVVSECHKFIGGTPTCFILHNI